VRVALNIENADFVLHITVPLVNEAFMPTEDDITQAEEIAVDAVREEIVFPCRNTEKDLFFMQARGFVLRSLRYGKRGFPEQTAQPLLSPSRPRNARQANERKTGAPKAPGAATSERYIYAGVSYTKEQAPRRTYA
jgi:hypothetical protein